MEKGQEIIKPFLKRASQAVTHVGSKQKQVNLIPQKFFDNDFIHNSFKIVGYVVPLVTLGSFIIDELLRNKAMEKQDSLLSIELQNVGTCKHCGKPLIDSTYVPDGVEDNHNAYIICKKCSEKNFARYADENDSEA